MSNDLISRSALLEDFRNTITERSDTFDWLNMINRQPTAYDIEDIVRDLETRKELLKFANIPKSAKTAAEQAYLFAISTVKDGSK